MARLGMVIDDAKFGGGHAFNGPEFQTKDRQEQERFIAQLAKKAKFYMEHGHVRMDNEEF
jgi:hypothetical protein